MADSKSTTTKGKTLGGVLSRFNAKWTPDPGTGCWLWTASLTGPGYGQFGVKGRVELAHRVSYELHVGAIPDGLCVLHRCDVRHCVNPNHLFLGTHSDNSRDCVSKGRHGNGNKLKTHCPQGHPYSGDNLYNRPDGGRTCRECTRVFGLARYHAKRRLKLAEVLQIEPANEN